MHDLFGHIAPLDPPKETMAEGAVLLRGAALPFEKEVLAALNEITAISPFRHMVTPGGFTMSVATTNCGAAGWVTDRTGYRYDGVDPETGNPWPPMPGCFLDLAAAASGGSRLSGVPSRRVPDQSLSTRCAPVAPPGQERARLRQSDRLRVAGFAGDFPVRRPEAK